MAVTILSTTNSFNPGSDLWIVSDFAHSKNTAKLDWYMNFQMSRSLRHQKQALSQQLMDLLAKTRLGHLHFTEDPHQGILYSTIHVLPNRWVLFIPHADPLDGWCERIAKKWEGLRRPTLRIFLPQNVSSQAFEKAWLKVQKFDDLSLVLD